ncbi:MAG: hypothetical protein QXY47_07530 [Thermoplasmata archaeon]
MGKYRPERLKIEKISNNVNISESKTKFMATGNSSFKVNNNILLVLIVPVIIGFLMMIFKAG